MILRPLASNVLAFARIRKTSTYVPIGAGAKYFVAKPEKINRFAGFSLALGALFQMNR